MIETGGIAGGTLDHVVDLVCDDELFAPLDAPGGNPVYASGAFTPFVLAVHAQRSAAGRPLVVVAPDEAAARDLSFDLKALLPRRPVRHYPARGVLYESHLAPPPHLVGLRIAALEDLTTAESDAVVVASIGALAERIPDPELRPHGFELAVGEVAELDELARQLTGCGYERCDRVEDRGQFAIRGDILDVFPATEDHAVRIELFDIEIESIRRFSTFTQRSLEQVQRIEMAPAAELGEEHRDFAAALGSDGDDRPDIADLLPLDRFGDFFDIVPENALLAVAANEELEPALHELWTDIEAAMHDTEAHGLYVRPSTLLDQLEARSPIELSRVATGSGAELRAEHPHSTARDVPGAEIELEKLLRGGYRVVVVWRRPGEAQRAAYNLARVKPNPLDKAPERQWEGVFFATATLREGFVSPALKLALVPDHLLVRRASGPAPVPGRRARISSFADLAVSDVIVHEDHGIARFTGFDTRTVAGVTRDYLTLEYRDGDSVFLPAEQLHKVTRYLGAHAADDVRLSKLGGKAWETLKAKARRAAHEMAGELITLYAERRAANGFAFSPDGELQRDFEESFPYHETPDQLQAIEQTKAGMEDPAPMDRLICGDVGYGKTEVALRAAFKSVQDSKQVLVLAPTTILTQQHFGTFKERMRDYPVTVDFASRFRSKAELSKALHDFESGRTDILIGTHRLLSPDVRPHDLGLIVIDEEQRFGVKQKELLRQMKLKVDVISLSATPIPRTLQMSLAGLRDISVIATPPEGRRPVRTHVGEYDDEIVRQALEREAARGGQSLFLHDLIESIDEMAERLKALCPRLTFAVVHGKLDEKVLEERMLAFLRGEFDVLVCTTIVESGLDIPSANTLVVERSDKLGLAQMYQIRGRVGRGRERAFSYFLYPSAAALSEVAAARITTLSDYTELGAGFRVAMRDLEIRGAGNLLGEEQSGHVAAVGFDLYVSMIEAAVAEIEGHEAHEPEEPVRLDVSIDAYVPGDYVTYEQAKIEVHRRIASAREPADLGVLREELEDRFGLVPEPLDRLLKLQLARLELGRAGVRVAGLRSGRLLVSPLELGAAQVAELRERFPAAIYDRDQRSLALRVDDDPDEQLVALGGLAAALAGLKSAASAQLA